MAPSGEGQIITSASFSDTSRLFDADRKLIPVSAYRKFEFGTYIEYGVTSWLTAVAAPSIDRIQDTGSSGQTQTKMGIGDTAVGARLLVYQTTSLENSNFVASVQALLRPPLGLQTASATQSFTHSQTLTGEMRGLVGYSTRIGGYDGFADIEMGYRWNDTLTQNEWRMDLTLGLHATDRALLLLQSFTSISDGRARLNPSYYWDKGQASVVYSFNAAWSAQLGGFLTVAGRNAGREMGPVAALWYRF